MSLEDLHAQQPLPGVDPVDLGLPAWPTPPTAPAPTPLPAPPQDGSRTAMLTGLAALLTGGPSLSGLAPGLMAGQQQQQQQQWRTYQQQASHAALQDRQQQARYADAQQTYEAQAGQFQRMQHQRQQVLADAVGQVRQRLEQGVYKKEADYTQDITALSSLLQQAYGIRVTPNFFRQAAQWRAPDEAKQVYTQLEQAFKNPLLKDRELRPEDTLQFTRADGTTRRYTLAEAIAFSNYPMVLSDTGQFKRVAEKPLTPSDAAGKAGELAEIRAELLAGGAVDDQALARKVREAYDVRERKRAAERAQAVKAATGGGTSADPELASIKRETAAIQRDLAKQKLEAGQQPGNQAAAAYGQERAGRILASVQELFPRVSLKTVGPGRLIAGLVSSDARDFQADVDALKASIAFNELTQMRAASKTGGALGAVSDRELTLLSAALGSLDTGQSPAAFRRQLRKIEAAVNRWRSAAAQSGASPTTQAPNAVIRDPVTGALRRP